MVVVVVTGVFFRLMSSIVSFVSRAARLQTCIRSQKARNALNFQ
jgi:hypothetical protein